MPRSHTYREVRKGQIKDLFHYLKGRERDTWRTNRNTNHREEIHASTESVRHAAPQQTKGRRIKVVKIEETSNVTLP